jgi:endonuclease/exonuclease/phosphatase family metal-dependent hydrolase
MDYSQYPRPVLEDIVRLRRQMERLKLPRKLVDRNVLVGTWNIRAFGTVYPKWGENPASPKRNLRAMAYIAEIIRRFDVVAIQEVKEDLSGLRLLMDWLGPDWGFIVTDVTAGSAGNTERLAYVFDRRRVQPAGLAGEIVLPPTDKGDPAQQFARTPYIVGFQAGAEQFVLLTAHILYGKVPADRIGEISALSRYSATELHSRSKSGSSQAANLIILGDFNIDQRGDDPLFKAFRADGLMVPEQLENLRTAFVGKKPKFYDQIAWFMGDFNLELNSAGVLDFADVIYPEVSLVDLSFRISDHLPLWAEFALDRSGQQVVQALGLDRLPPDPDHPDPLDTVPEIGPRRK